MSYGSIYRFVNEFQLFIFAKIRRGPKLEGYAFANFGNSSGTEEEPSQKREKNGGKKKKRSKLPRPGIKPGTCR